MRGLVLPPDTYDFNLPTSYAQIFVFEGDVPFSWSDWDKGEAPLKSVFPVDLDSFQVNHEVLCFEAKCELITVTADVTFTFEWINLDTGTSLATVSYTVTKEDWNSWSGYIWPRCWIGKCAWEINGPMNVMVNVMIDSNDPNARGEGQFYIEVIGEPLGPGCKESDIDIALQPIWPAGRNVTVNGYVVTSNPECSINQLTWDWGDDTGPMSAFFPQTHEYASDGLYTLSITAEDDCCNSETKNTLIAIGLTADEVAFKDKMHLMGFGGDIISSIISLAREFWDGVAYWSWTAANELHKFFWDTEFTQEDAGDWARNVGEWWPFTNGMAVIIWEKNLRGETQTELSAKDIGELALIIAGSALGGALWSKFGAAVVSKLGSVIGLKTTSTLAGWETAVTTGGGNLANYKIIVGSMASGAAMSTGAKILALAMTPFIITEFPQLWAMLTFARYEVPDHISREFSLLENDFDREMWLFKDNMDAGNLAEAGTNIAAMKAAIEEYKLRLADYKTDLEDFGLYELHVQTLAALEHGYETFKATWEEAGGEPPAGDCLLTIESTPSGAKIYIDGEYKFVETPHTLSVAWGPHLIALTKEGYTSSEETYTVPETDTDTYSVTLEEEEPPPPPPEKGTLHVTCSVSTADVYVNGTKRGVTPLTYVLDPGQYHILVSKFQHTSYETDVTIIANQTTEVSAEIMPETPPPEKALLQVGSNPQGASIFRDDADTGQVTQHTFELDPGTYKITLKLADYPDAEQTVTLIAGQTFEMYYDFTIPYYPPEVEVEVTMTPITHEYNAWKYRFRAKDAVTGAEINAKIFIDDEDTGKWSPWYFYLEELKTYVVRLERYGYHPATVTITTEQLPVIP